MAASPALLRRARRWWFETLAFDIQIHPSSKSYRVWSRHLHQLRRHDPALWAAVYESMELDAARNVNLTYEQWSAKASREMRQIKRIRARGIRPWPQTSKRKRGSRRRTDP